MVPPDGGPWSVVPQYTAVRQTSRIEENNKNIQSIWTKDLICAQTVNFMQQRIPKRLY